VALAEQVRAVLERQVAEGSQTGVQVAAYHHGQPVVDEAAGVMGPGDPRPVRPDTLFYAFSVVKGVAALAVHMLADRGLIDYDAPVAEYWPAFGASGKAGITVAQALSHQAGLHAMPEPFDLSYITDLEAGLRFIEQAEPAYEPGTATGYHAQTFGWIVAGLVRGAAGREIDEFVREEIAEPLGVADELYLRLPQGLEDRLATLEVAKPPGTNEEFERAAPGALWSEYNSIPVRRALLPSVVGHFTARALARVYAAIAPGVDGVRLISPERLASIQRQMTSEPDLVLRFAPRKGIGFWLGQETNGVPSQLGARPTSFGHIGIGGFVAYCDPVAELSLAVLVNRQQYPAGGTAEICGVIREELGAS
jgi:CubicO group peptidase (beta-lactamase class C family)